MILRTTMRRGDVVTIADRAGDHTGEPRPAVIVQSDLFGDLDGVFICPLTTVAADTHILRFAIQPSDTLKLSQASWIMVDKIASVRRSRVGAIIGRLPAADMQRLNGALAVFLGLG